MQPRYSLAVVKVGTNVITGADGLLDEAVMRALTADIAALCDEGARIVLVSSGAMAAGLAAVKPATKLPRVAQRQLLAAVGQVRLIERYAQLFSTHTYIPAQVLATKEDFRDRQHYLNMRSCLGTLLDEGIIPIVNENDVVSVSELMFTDNDELAGLIASMMNADALILLTSVDGVFDGEPGTAGATLIASIDPLSTEWKKSIRPGTSQFGRGGMLTKCANAVKLAQLGITTHIANGRTPGVIRAIFDGKSVGTTIAAAKAASSIKRWVAGSEGTQKGVVTINACAVDILTSREKAVSLLPVGIVGVSGEFETGDLIAIRSESGEAIGLGIARYGAEAARHAMGRKNQKPLVHYDYLYLS